LTQGCNAKFHNALLATSRIEMFMPGVEIVSEGDHVNELHILMAGDVRVCMCGQAGWHKQLINSCLQHQEPSQPRSGLPDSARPAP
jgi:hypothetical protein